MRFKWLILSLLCLGISSLACNSANITPTATVVPLRPPSTFQEADLVGTWERSRVPGHADETLLIMADKTFKQIYDVTTSGYHYEGTGRWWIEHRPSGCVYIHLEGMRYYYGTVEQAEAGNRDTRGTPIPYWDPCENRSVTMPDSVIMIVGSHSSLPRGIKLVNLLVDRDEGDKVLHLVPIPTSSP
jgi:hypothetical protein